MRERGAVVDGDAAVAAPLLRAERVRKSYRTWSWGGRGGREVLVDASLTIRPGEIVAVTGENGSGKSTLIRILAGLCAPDSGAVVRHVSTGYCPQERCLFEALTPDETFRYFGTAYGLSAAAIEAATRELLARFGFEAYRHVPVSQLSEGTRQKLNLSVATMHHPQLLLLDEPYAGLDEPTFRALWEMLRQFATRGHGCLVVMHLLHHQDRFDRLFRLVSGRLVECG